MELVNVVCLYWGNKYKTEYVNVLDFCLDLEANEVLDDDNFNFMEV